MIDLYARILLWHKLVAMQTGGLALCSAKRKLNRDEAKGWADVLRNVADDIDSVLAGAAFVLDDKGQRVVQSGVSRASTRTENRPPQEVSHEIARLTNVPEPFHRTVSRKVGGPRVATRRKQ